MPELNDDIMKCIQDCLKECNPYIKVYQTAGEMFAKKPTQDIGIQLMSVRKEKDDIGTTNAHRYDKPEANEVAAIIPNITDDCTIGDTYRDILVTTRSNPYTTKKGKEVEKLERIHPFGCSAYESLHYLIMFPYGTQGWAYKMLNLAYNEKNQGRKKNVTILRYMGYHFAIRDTSMRDVNDRLQALIPHSFTRLFQEYTVDSGARIEENNLNYARNHQMQFRGQGRQGIIIFKTY